MLAAIAAFYLDLPNAITICSQQVASTRCETGLKRVQSTCFWQRVRNRSHFSTLLLCWLAGKSAKMCLLASQQAAICRLFKSATHVANRFAKRVPETCWSNLFERVLMQRVAKWHLIGLNIVLSSSMYYFPHEYLQQSLVLMSLCALISTTLFVITTWADWISWWLSTTSNVIQHLILVMWNGDAVDLTICTQYHKGLILCIRHLLK